MLRPAPKHPAEYWRFALLAILLICLPQCVHARSLAVITPNGGEWYEIAETVNITWTTAGTDWQASDTIKIEYSTDDGVNWNTIQDARRLDYNLGTYAWSTSGVAPSYNCWVKITCNNDKNVNDTSNSGFIIQADTTAPSIAHTTINDNPNTTGPYEVRATVTDNRSLSYVKLYWSRNGGAYSSVTMSPTGVTDEYSGNIPGPSAQCDTYHYYIEARDSSVAGNTTRNPTTAPSSANYFGISAPSVVDNVSVGTYSKTYAAYSCLNTYRCKQTTILTQIEQMLSFASATNIKFLVYHHENSQGTWKFVKIFESTQNQFHSGPSLYSSGTLSVRLEQGGYYLIGCSWEGSGTFYYGYLSDKNVSFGNVDYLRQIAAYPPPDPITTTAQDQTIAQQRLTTSASPRGLAIDTQNEWELYEPGDDVPIQWHTTGACWSPTDTIKLQYSSNGGSTWLQIPGAESIPCNTGSFTWNTTGCPYPSYNYRVKAVCNSENAIYDINNDNFYLDVDDGPPMIYYYSPPVDTYNRLGPYKVKAYIWDNNHYGIADATLYWSRNGGIYTAVPMTRDEDGYYCANIPGMSAAGDVYDYYVVAHDASDAHNEARSPAGSYQFSILSPLVEYFTEQFSPAKPFDLQYMSITFTPNGSSDYYSASVQPIAALPTDPAGGTVAQMEGDGCIDVTLADSRTVSLYGAPRNNVWISTEGYLTLDTGWFDYSGSLTSHFKMRRVAGLCDDLKPAPGSVTYKQLADRFAVTYLNVVTDYGSTPSTFQIEMFFDGRVRISYLDVEDPWATVGLSAGLGVPAQFVESDLSGYQPPRGLVLSSPNGGEWIEPGETAEVRWRATGPYWSSSDAVRLEYSSDGGSSWIPVSGASALAWSSSTFALDTTGLSQSASCRLRVTANDDSSIMDTSDSDFSLAPDTEAPAITHDAVLRSSDLVGPHRVRARVTDNRGLAEVTLYWRRNGGTYAPVTMSVGALLDEYVGDIPGPSVLGDAYSYYIEARDTADSANVTRSPAGTPASAYTLDIVPGTTESLGANQNGSGTTPGLVANTFQCTKDCSLTKIEQYLVNTSAADPVYVVYESPSATGAYTKIAQQTAAVLSPMIGFVSSGPMLVHLTAGRYYIIGALVPWGVQGSFKVMTSNPTQVNFGARIGGLLRSSMYYAEDTIINNNTAPTWEIYQQLTTSPASRSVAITAPNGGEWYEPGDTALIEWQTTPQYWSTGETIRLDCSTDGGSTWNPVALAQNLPYNQRSFTWNTTGAQQSTHYRVRATMNGYAPCTDASDADFTVVTDTTPPAIAHAPLPDQGSLTGPYTVTATVTDPSGVSEVKLFWRKSDGEYAAVTMNAVGASAPNNYAASFSSPSVLGDIYCYYIQAKDSSVAGNVAVEPASAPGQPHCFNISNCGTETLGVSDSLPLSAYYYYCRTAGSVFSCTTESVLTRIEQYIDTTGASEVRFVVYEGVSTTGAFTRIHENVVSSPGQGRNWCVSGPIEVQMLSGKYYAICASTPSNASYYYNPTVVTQGTLFGESVKVFYNTTTPPPSSMTLSTYTGCALQRLTTCRYSRALEIKMPNGGGWYEVGDTVPIQWSATGLYWQAADTVKLEYSSDGGTTWQPIAGAESLAYNSGAFDWNTGGCVNSDQYRLRVIFNGDAAITDASDADFTIRVDAVPPLVSHTPLCDTSPYVGNYTAYATITDNYKMGAATLYWRKNAGDFAAVAMTGSGSTYSAAVPRSGSVGDTYEYYIVAQDGSHSANTARTPASGYYQFGLIDWLYEVIGYKQRSSTQFDLVGTTVTFTPDGSRSFYGACRKPFLQLPTDPTGGTALTLTDNSFAQVTLAGGKQVSIFGTPYGSFFVGSNGYITFDAGDITHNAYDVTQFSAKRISGLFTNLYPVAQGSVTWKQLADRVAVTFAGVPEVNTTCPNTFQIEMFFDGRIALSYLHVEAITGIVGLSSGPRCSGAYTTTSDFTAYPLCCPGSFELTDSVLPESDGVLSFGPIPVGTSQSASILFGNAGSCEVIVDAISSSLQEDFSDGAAQSWTEYPDGAWNVTCGEYTYSTSASFYYPSPSTTLYTGATYSDFRYQVRMRAGQNTSAPMYVLFRASSFASPPGGYPGPNGYFVGLDVYNRRYEVHKLVNGTMTYLRNWTSSTAIVGSTAPNVVTVEAVGSRFTLYINGVSVWTFTDISHAYGYVGLGGVADYSGGLTFWFDDVSCTPIINGILSDPSSFEVNGLPYILPRVMADERTNAVVTYTPQAEGPSFMKLTFATRGTNVPFSEILLRGVGTSTATPGELKARADGSRVGVRGKWVIAVFADRFYLENDDRCGGICVLWNGMMPEVGDLVTVGGAMTSSDGERAIQATDLFIDGHGSAPEPIGMAGKLLGGGAAGVQAAVDGGFGVNNLGTLVAIWGRVTQLGTDYIYIDDGSAIRDGTTTGPEPNIGVRVMCSPAGRAPGDILKVTGVSSCFRTPASRLARKILVRSSSDIHAVQH